MSPPVALPDIELVPTGAGPAEPRPAAPAWKAPPVPDIERIPDDVPRPRTPSRQAPARRPPTPPRPVPARPVARARRPLPPVPPRPAPAAPLRAPAARAAVPAPPVARPAPAPAPVELEVPSFVARTPPPAPPPASPPATHPPTPASSPARRSRPRWGRIAAAVAAVAGAAVLTGIGMSGDAEQPSPGAAAGLAAITPAAVEEIPPAYLRLYVRFGREMDIDWRFLAAIGGQESDHGRHPAAARVNRSGCVGPMQLGVGGSCGDFVGAWGVDGDGDGRVDPRTPADAIATAANGLRNGKGAPATGGPYLAYRRAACGYYGACADSWVDYADDVMERAVRFGLPPR